MKRRFAAVMLAAMLVALLAPASASAAQAGMVTGGVRLVAMTGDTASVEFAAREARGQQGEAGYRPAEGVVVLRYAGEVEVYAVDMCNADPFGAGGMAVVHGWSADGKEFGIVIGDSGSPGSGNDFAFTAGSVPMFWGVAGGNLTVHAQ